MRRKFFRTVKGKKYYGIITAVSWGVFTIITLVCVCGICMTKFDIPDAALYAVSCFSLGMGGYISGYVCGKIKRREGIVSGLKCGLLLWGIISVFGIVYMRGFSVPVLLRDILFLCVPSIAGGIYGVNKKNYRPPYN